MNAADNHPWFMFNLYIVRLLRCDTWKTDGADGNDAGVVFTSRSPRLEWPSMCIAALNQTLQQT